MAIKETEIEVLLWSNSYKHYEDRGYFIPTYLDRWNRTKIKKGTKIFVKVEDLPKGSQQLVTKICDDCDCEVSKQTYYAVLKGRKKHNGKDYCKYCSDKKNGIKNGIADESNCVAITHPEIAKLFWNVEDTFKYKYASNKIIFFKCPQCGSKVKNRPNVVNRLYRVPCYCNDHISYGEKFMFSLLTQLNVNFETRKTFDWSKNIIADNSVLNGTKQYDFYLIDLKTVIETHGIQHVEKSFERMGGRTLAEEQENDELKKILAENNEIVYLPVDCRYSEMEFIKLNIENSLISKRFDLSKIDWLKCHEYACNSIVIKASELCKGGLNVKEISEILKRDKSTIRDYLNKGKILGLCNYDSKKEIRKNGIENGKKGGKPVIKISLNGDYICEWESIIKAKKELGKGFSKIGEVCNGKRKTAGDYLWMFKDDYEKSIKEKTLTKL